MSVSYLEIENLQSLFEALKRRGFRVVGPTVRDGAIVHDDLATADDLPVGWTDEQDGGTYRLKRCDDSTRFGYVVGPHSWKKFLFPPAKRLWTARRDGEAAAWQVDPEPQDATRYAFIGVRACELQAIAVQDRVFTGGEHIDPDYGPLRERSFTVAVNCSQAGGTCFCVSMDSGPRCDSGFDLVLTEIRDGGRQGLVIEPGSEKGRELLDELPRREATRAEIDAANRAVERAASQMGRELRTEELPARLARNLEHPRWDEVAARCLSCGNCTMVCPTCFCTGVEDVTDLAGERADRVRHWDSCFSVDYSYIHGGSVRRTTRSRYRQWMTHKLSTWVDQFGTSGCVGCGRCITWCPVGIDITEEVRAIDSSEEDPPEEKADGPEERA